MYLYSEEYIVASNFLTATASVLVWELIITLDDEINYIWQQPWTLGTILFAVNRYLPFVDTFMALYLQMTVTTQEMCRSYYTAITWIVAIGLMVSELIILLRTWALWQRKRIIFFILGGMSTLTFGPGIAVTSLEIKSLRFGDTPLGGRGCKLEEASKTILVAYALIALSETVVVTLTVIRGMDHLRSSSRSSWVTRVYGYGLLFYIYLLIITLVNIIVPLVAAQPLYKNYLAIPLRAFHSIFCTRVILLIQRQRWERLSESCRDDELSNHRQPITKTNMTGNILETAINTRYTADFNILGGKDEHEMTTYRKDWMQ